MEKIRLTRVGSDYKNYDGMASFNAVNERIVKEQEEAAAAAIAAQAAFATSIGAARIV